MVDKNMNAGILKGVCKPVFVSGEKLWCFIAHLEVRDYSVVVRWHDERLNLVVLQ